MNVYPTLIDHPKFRAFKNALRAHSVDAAEILLRLWGHCQSKQLGENWGRVTPEFVEAICNWEGKPGVLWDLLTRRFFDKDGWIRVNRGQVIICGWEEHNKSLLNRWEAGKKGGRPKGTSRKPKDNLPVTDGKPTENLILESTREDCTGVDGTKELSLSEVAPAGEQGDGEGKGSTESRPTGGSVVAEWPLEKEWLEFCARVGLPEWKARLEWANQERKRPKWKGIGDWQKHATFIRTLWQQDGAPAQPPGIKNRAPLKNAARPSASAQAYALREEKEALMVAIGEHPANEDSTAYSPHCTAAQVKDLADKKARLREVFGLLAAIGGGNG